MANIKSAIRRIEITKRNNARNVSVKSEIKTKIKSVHGASDQAKGQGLFVTAQKTLAKAVSRGIVHKKQASRRISRLAKSLAKQKV